MTSSASLETYSQEEVAAYCWKKGDLDYLLRPHQDRIEKAFIDSKERTFVEEIGRQVGKTYWNLKKAVEVCLIIPAARVKYASAFLTSVEEYAVPNLKKIINQAPAHLRPTWLDSKKKAIFKNGSELKLLGLDRSPDAGRGPYCDLYVIDEAGFVKNLESIIDSVILPMFNTRPWGRIVLSSSSPESPAHPFIGFADKYALPEFNSYIMLTIDDNHDLTPVEIEKIKSEYTSQTAMLRELYCKRIVEASRAIVPEWDDKFIRDTPHDEFRWYYHNYLFMDLGVKKDLTAGILAYYDFVRAKLVCEDEFDMVGPEMTTNALQRLIRAKEKERWTSPLGQAKAHKRIADNNNPLLIQDLNATYQLPFQSTDKTGLRAMVNKLRIMTQQDRIEIHPRCRKLIGCLKSGVWDDARKEFDHSIAFGHFDHLAALIYGVRNVDYHSNPIPVTHGFNVLSPNTLIFPQKKKTILRQFGD